MKRLLGKRYRVAVTAARATLGALLCLFLLGGALGCTGFAEEARSDHSPAGDAAETAQRLYDSMEIVFRRETAGIDIALEERLMLISHYEEVDSDRRRRFVGRVVPIGRGGMGVKIRAEYQNEAHADDGEGGLIWHDEPREAVEEEAAPEELRMARMVERVYHGGTE